MNFGRFFQLSPNSTPAESETLGSSLKDAKDAVEALQRDASLPQSTEDHPDLEAEVLRWLGQGEKIKAVSCTKIGQVQIYSTSKQAVDEIAERHGITVAGGAIAAIRSDISAASR